MEPIQTEFALQLRVLIEAPIEVGPTPDGARQFISITGGTFSGPDLSGVVLSGGADWQRYREDKVLEIEAIYAIRTTDDIVIQVRNRGLVDRTVTPPYVRTQPVFQAPAGRLDWLNRSLFVGTITPSTERDHVLVDVFRVL